LTSVSPTAVAPIDRSAAIAATATARIATCLTVSERAAALPASFPSTTRFEVPAAARQVVFVQEAKVFRPPIQGGTPHYYRRRHTLIELTTLRDGGQSADDVAVRVVAFLAEARKTLELALYDIDLREEPEQLIAGALVDAHERGVVVRIAYNIDYGMPIPVPPPPKGVPDLIEALPFETRAIAGEPDLMHHKYAIRDGEAVFTGSANWTSDSWTRQENVLAMIESSELARRYELDFEQLWSVGSVELTGDVEPAVVDVGGRRVRAWFCPGRGESLAHRIATRISRARQRVRICSPVLTSAPVLGSLAEAVADGKVDVAGCIDATQMQGVFYQWRENGNAAWKMPLVEAIFRRVNFSGKRSTPYGRGDDVHDYMHAKLTVCDDIVFVGSYNLSHSGERNAENVLEIEDRESADRMAAFVDEVRARYPEAPLPGDPEAERQAAAR
jgi:phosphatidylserine/phosphatidylglycerophosphate/cardiolipin synthase-like enzyme